LDKLEEENAKYREHIARVRRIAFKDKPGDPIGRLLDTHKRYVIKCQYNSPAVFDKIIEDWTLFLKRTTAR